MNDHRFKPGDIKWCLRTKILRGTDGVANVHACTHGYTNILHFLCSGILMDSMTWLAATCSNQNHELPTRYMYSLADSDGRPSYDKNPDSLPFGAGTRESCGDLGTLWTQACSQTGFGDQPVSTSPRPACPMKGTSGSMKETSGSMKETSGSMTETSGSMKETSGSMKGTAAPLQETAAAMKETAAPMKETSGSMKETAAPMKETAAAMKETAAPMKETAEPTKSFAASPKNQCRNLLAFLLASPKHQHLAVPVTLLLMHKCSWGPFHWTYLLDMMVASCQYAKYGSGPGCTDDRKTNCPLACPKQTQRHLKTHTHTHRTSGLMGLHMLAPMKQQHVQYVRLEPSHGTNYQTERSKQMFK